MGCLEDIVRVVNESATHNVAQLVGTQHGKILMPMYDWCSFFEDATVKTALKGIKQMHNFHFSKSHPGKVMVHNISTDEWRTIIQLKDPSWCPVKPPEQVILPDLPLE